MIKKTVVLLIAILLFACSSIKSIEIPDTKVKDYSDHGLMYFMPKKDFLVTITVDKEKKISKVTLETTASYPDLSKQFVLRYSRNYIGKNTLDVGTTTQGLLTSTKSTTLSNVVDVLKNLATTAGMVTPYALKKIEKPGVVDKSCETIGDHSFVLEGPGKYEKICGMTIDIERRGNPCSVVKHSKKDIRT